MLEVFPDLPATDSRRKPSLLKVSSCDCSQRRKKPRIEKQKQKEESKNSANNTHVIPPLRKQLTIAAAQTGQRVL